MAHPGGTLCALTHQIPPLTATLFLIFKLLYQNVINIFALWHASCCVYFHQTQEYTMVGNQAHKRLMAPRKN
jgi:hypothetical protein